MQYLFENDIDSNVAKFAASFMRRQTKIDLFNYLKAARNWVRDVQLDRYDVTDQESDKVNIKKKSSKRLTSEIELESVDDLQVQAEQTENQENIEQKTQQEQEEKELVQIPSQEEETTTRSSHSQSREGRKRKTRKTKETE